jgi:hypothetical protein
MQIVDFQMNLLRVNIFFVTMEGQLAAVLKSVEAPCSQELNRIAGADRSGE